MSVDELIYEHNKKMVLESLQIDEVDNYTTDLNERLFQ